MNEQITKVLTATSADLGLTAEQAQQLMDGIVSEGLTSDDALSAYDLLHGRVTFGRAF